MSKIVAKEYIKYSPKADFGFVFETWPKGFYYGGLTIGIESDKKTWFQKFYLYVKKQLEEAKVYIACMSDDPTTILGYAVINGTTLEWIYVKEKFRMQGIASLLLNGKTVDSYNNMTKLGQIILEKQREKHGSTKDR